MIAPYLRKLGVTAGPPSVDLLFELHRAQVSRVPYANIEIMLGVPGGVEAHESIARIMRGNGGYCFQLNGAFGALLSELGFTVTRHRGYVVGRDELPGTDAALNHLALDVHGLPTNANPGGLWLVDAGLGDAIYEPLPLGVGSYRQGPFEYRLVPTVRAESGWRLEHDAAGSFAAADLIAEPVDLAAFADAHRRLSTAPDSPFVRTFTVQRRTATAVEILRGCQLTRIGATGSSSRTLNGHTEWRQVLADVFGVTEPRLAQLWPVVSQAHEAWLARPRSGDTSEAAVA